MRSTDDERELPLGTYEHFAARDPLTRAVMDRVLAGVWTRKFAGIRFVVDGAKALAKAIHQVFGTNGRLHRCHRHKERTSPTSCPRQTATWLAA